MEIKEEWFSDLNEKAKVFFKKEYGNDWKDHYQIFLGKLYLITNTKTT